MIHAGNTLYPNYFCHQTNIMIPNIIHQIWIQGYNQAPTELKKFCDECQIINANFRHVLWDDVRIKRLLQEYFAPEYLQLYNSYTVFAQKADFSRYIILYIYGGIYLDFDTKCKRNLVPFLGYDLFFTTDIYYRIHRVYPTGIIGARPNHPVFLIVLQNLVLRHTHTHKPDIQNITYATGTKLFYDSVETYRRISGDNNIAIIDRKYLHPCAITDKKNCVNKCNDCYIVHTNYSSWSPGLRVIKYIFENLEYIILFILIIIIVVILPLKV